MDFKLNKECELGSGVMLSCFVINSIFFDIISGTAQASVRGYISADALAQGKAPAWTGTFMWNAGDNPQLAGAAIQLSLSKLASEIDSGKIK